MPSANNKQKAIQQQLQRREAEWAVNVDYLEAMIQEKNLENINLSYESLSPQKLELDKLSDELFKYNLTQNELKEIMEKSAERSLVILKWKKYRKDHSREATTDSDSHLPERQRSAQPQQNNSQNDEPSTTHKPYYNRQQKTYNLRNKSKAESSTDKITTLAASEKQQQRSRNPQHGQKDDDDIEQSNHLIGNNINSDTASMGGGDTTSMADNKYSNDKYNQNSYIEFPLRHFGYSQKQRRTDPKTNFTQIRERTLELNDESKECTSSKMIASFPNNNGDHHIRAEQGKSNGDEDSTKSRETIEVNYKEQNIGPVTIRRDVGTTTSNDKPTFYKHAKRKQKIHQSDVSTESDCSSNQTFDTNIPDQRKTQPHQQQSRQNLHPFNRKQSSNEITPSHRINQQTTDNDSNYLQSTDDESDDHQQLDNIRLRSNTTHHYELQPKRKGARKRERKIDKIHDVNLASTNTQFQATQGQVTSNIHAHVQNQEQQFLQSIDFYQDANKINRSNQSNDRELSSKPVNNLIPETNNNLCNFNLNAQDQRLPNYINRTGQQPDRQFQHTQTTENPFLPRQAQQQPVTSSINLPKTQLKSFSGDPLRWHDWFSFFKATIHDNITLTDAQRMTYL